MSALGGRAGEGAVAVACQCAFHIPRSDATSDVVEHSRTTTALTHLYSLYNHQFLPCTHGASPPVQSLISIYHYFSSTSHFIIKRIRHVFAFSHRRFTIATVLVSKLRACFVVRCIFATCNLSAHFISLIGVNTHPLLYSLVTPKPHHIVVEIRILRP